MTNKMSNKCGHLCQNDSLDEFVQIEMFDKVEPKVVALQCHAKDQPIRVFALEHPHPVLGLSIGLVTQQHKNMSNKCANQAKNVEQMIDRKENVKQMSVLTSRKGVVAILSSTLDTVSCLPPLFLDPMVDQITLPKNS